MPQVPMRQPGDIVNEVYSENIPSIIKVCLDAGDDPSSIIQETKRELQVGHIKLMISFVSVNNTKFSEWLLR